LIALKKTAELFRWFEIWSVAFQSHQRNLNFCLCSQYIQVCLWLFSVIAQNSTDIDDGQYFGKEDLSIGQVANQEHSMMFYMT
jgi:hypothetical protein